jgi:hypothetical protein
MTGRRAWDVDAVLQRGRDVVQRTNSLRGLDLEPTLGEVTMALIERFDRIREAEERLVDQYGGW